MDFNCHSCAQKRWVFLKGKVFSYGCALLPISTRTFDKKLEYYIENCPLKKIREMDLEARREMINNLCKKT